MAAARVNVGAGRLMANGMIYFNADEGGVELDLLTSLPVVTRKYIAVIVWGQVIDTQTEPRTFLTDVTTRATVARVVATQNVRHANIVDGCRHGGAGPAETGDRGQCAAGRLDPVRSWRHHLNRGLQARAVIARGGQPPQ